MICKDKAFRTAVDEELSKGVSGAYIARLMGMRGFPVTAETVRGHKQHATPIAPAGVAKRKTDAATYLLDRMVRAVERMPEPTENDDWEDPILDKKLQPALHTALKAQSLLERREAREDDKQAVLQLRVLVAGGGAAGFLAPPDLVDDETDPDLVIEGEAEEIEPGEEVSDG